MKQTEETTVGPVNNVEMQEEVKQGENTNSLAAAKVDRVITQLKPVKKADKSATFRSFMKTQKQDLSVNMDGKAQTMEPKADKFAPLIVESKDEAKAAQQEAIPEEQPKKETD